MIKNTNNINTNACNNCGKVGHMFHQCKLPITSYGIIAYRYKLNEIQFLMIRRKDSFGFIDFIRGKYSPYNIYQIQNIINEMSVSEKERLITESFTQLWNTMWGENYSSQYKNEEHMSSKKMDILLNSVTVNEEKITLQEIIEKSPTKWEETEWEFPKGRRNFKETELECALREFQEETGISKEKLFVIENLVPFEELFIGTNHKSYKHKYFLAFIDKNDDILNNYQLSEVSKIEWKTLDECLNSIRPYNLEKKNLIININKVLQEYRLY
jgi:8-oxo-dGTP pyrophosphatase MutT (NUDIX family)